MNPKDFQPVIYYCEFCDWCSTDVIERNRHEAIAHQAELQVIAQAEKDAHQWMINKEFQKAYDWAREQRQQIEHQGLIPELEFWSQSRLNAMWRLEYNYAL